MINDVDPNAYLADVLARIVARHMSRIDELQPFAYVKPKAPVRAAA